MQPQAEFLTALQNLPQERRKRSNEIRRKISRTCQGVNQIRTSSKDTPEMWPKSDEQ